MKRMPLIALVGSLCAVSTALATTYVRVEKDGTKTYSDRPLPGGQPVDLQPAQTYSAPAAQSGKSSAPLEQRLLEQMDDFRYTGCALLPKNDETFTNPQSVNVVLSLQPGLRFGDAVDFKIDGVTVGNTTTTSYTLQPAFRGTHTVSVSIKDRYGKSLCNATTSFHVFQPSLNSPARR